MTLLVVLAPGVGSAKLGLGYHAPEVPMQPLEEFKYVKSLAAHLAKALGQPVNGTAYLRPGQLRKDMAKKKIQFAVLGGLYLAGSRPGKVVASSSWKSARWTLMAKSKAKLSALRGKVLQMPAQGRLLTGLVQNGILDGNLSVPSFFKLSAAPRLQSALAAIRLGKASLVFAPTSSGGLTPLLERTIPFPGPSFVIIDKKLPPATIAKVAKAILSFPGGKHLTAWRSGGGGSRLGGLSRKRRRRMLMKATTEAGKLKQSDVINSKLLEYQIPDLEGLYARP